MKSAVLVDMDGTLADVSSMRHYVKGDRKDFDRFHKSACLFAPVNEEVREYLRDASEMGTAVLIVTARKRMWGDLTKQWLDKHRIPYDRIYMRANNDQRKDYLVKKDILARIHSQGYNVVMAIDDNPNVIKLWESEGIDTWIIPGWED